MSQNQSRKLVLIEDDLLVAGLYLRRLEKEGYVIKSATDGSEGFYLVCEWKPSALILDLMLPNMNGVDIIKKLRAQGQFANLPILVLTNKYAEDISRQAQKAGATEVFDKGKATPDEIAMVLHRLLSPTAATTASAPAPALPDFSDRPAKNESVSPAPSEISESALMSPAAAEAMERANLEKTFYGEATMRIVVWREMLTNLIRAKEPEDKLHFLRQIHHATHLFSSSASLIGGQRPGSDERGHGSLYSRTHRQGARTQHSAVARLPNVIT